MGYVGPPPAAAFVEAGLSVVGIERDPGKVATLEGVIMVNDTSTDRTLDAREPCGRQVSRQHRDTLRRRPYRVRSPLRS